VTLSRKTPLRRGQPPKRGGKIAPKKRTKQERERIYGSPERQAWMREFGCVCCGRQPVQLHHVRVSGMGRKAGAEHTIPLCVECHRGVHAYGVKDMEEEFSFTLEGKTLREWAATFDAMWQRKQSRSSGLTPLSAIVPGVVKAMTEGDE
jgi:hypothetical protein